MPEPVRYARRHPQKHAELQSKLESELQKEVVRDLPLMLETGETRLFSCHLEIRTADRAEGEPDKLHLLCPVDGCGWKGLGAKALESHLCKGVHGLQACACHAQQPAAVTRLAMGLCLPICLLLCGRTWSSSPPQALNLAHLLLPGQSRCVAHSCTTAMHEHMPPSRILPHPATGGGRGCEEGGQKGGIGGKEQQPELDSLPLCRYTEASVCNSAKAACSFASAA